MASVEKIPIALPPEMGVPVEDVSIGSSENTKR
jgi:hypothetical protein